MRNIRKKSAKQTNNSVSKAFKFIEKLKLWQKIVAALLLAMIIAGTGVAIWHATRAGADTARFDLVVNQPSAATFTDNATIDFVGQNALPEPNNNREIGAPGELIVSYEQVSGPYAPALRMDLTDQDIAKKIKISPAVAGTWSRRGPNMIVFRPEHDWPADMRFSLKISPSLTNPDARISKSKTSFTTDEFTATVASFNTYPSDTPKSVIGVAIISFNYPVDTKKFADRATMRLDGKQIEYSVRFDRFHRTAFLTTTPIEITDNAQFLRLKINRLPAEGMDAATKKLTANITIESADNIFKIAGIETTVADDRTGLPQQLLLLDMTAAAAGDVKWKNYIKLYLLPKKRDNDAADDAPHHWADDEITPQVLEKATLLEFAPVEFENPAGVYKYAFEYDVSENQDRFIYVSVASGMSAASGFTLKNGSGRVLAVPYPARTVKIAGTGALLALGGEKQLGIAARGGVDAAYINLYKVKAAEINHLISQTYNIFGDMEFKSWSFDAYDMAVVFKKKIGFSDTSMKHVNYASVDLGDYLDRTHADKTGIFIVQTGPSQSEADYSDRRLILLTDLGLLRKVNLDGTSSLFVSNLTAATPADNVEVYVLGRNGNSVWAGQTDNSGRADIPALPWDEYRNEKSPVAIVARRGNDVSFIPYNDGGQMVEYSKFDVDGVYASGTTALNAFLFTDRGIYRPGENAVIAGIVKGKNFKALPGIPVKLEVRDARGRISLEKMFSLTPDGMFDVKYALPETAPLGEYNMQLYSLNAKNKIQDILGYGSFRIEEFTPDNLKISATMPGADGAGWIAAQNMTANVSLRNMFGTPAPDKRISARVILTPASFKFEKYPDYKFTNGFISGTGLADASAARTVTREQDEVRTDDNGNAVIELNLADQISDDATYNMTMIVNGFEGDSGRSVQTAIKARVSRAKYLVGWHANSDLSYIKLGAQRSVNLIAVDNSGTRAAAADITLRLVRRENLTSLVKDGAGYYKYQTVTRDKTITQRNVTIPDAGMDVSLDTATPGTYYLQALDADGKILANIEYFVAGNGNTDLQSDTRAELRIKLDAAQYAPGANIAVSITAPYVGYGLITLERDKVYAFKWFKTDTTNSVQHIELPDNFEGTGYVNVSFVRDINSRDVFTTPYTYAVAPFVADTARRTIGVRLKTPETVRDHKLTVGYEVNRDAKIMIFAVNEGILQVAKYQIPNPIAHFFKKAALQVETYQTLSLILPEYKILREFAKTGGGDYDGGENAAAGLTNPFGRRTDAPVAFYSEIISATANTPGTVTFDIPDAFNGALHVFAVAASDGAVGSADATVHVQSPVIVTMNAPLAVAPGDKFDINAVVANLTGDAKPATVRMQAVFSNNLAADKNAASTSLNIANGGEALWSFGASALDMPGNAEITVNADIAGRSAARGAATMSVRPAPPFATNISMGVLAGRTETLRPRNTDMYAPQSVRRLYISANADAVVRPLVEYLRHYQWNCTEQLVSRAMPYAVISASDILNISRTDSEKKIAETIDALKSRQNDDGSFAMWAGGAAGRNNESDAQSAYVTAYVAQFLTIAREHGFNVPRDMTSRALDYLRTYAGTAIRDDADAASHAYAIYVVTANEFVTTAYINQFEEWANKNAKGWESSPMGPYIASAYRIMRANDRGDKIMRQYKTGKDLKNSHMFENSVACDAIYNYLNTKYFDVTAKLPGKDEIKYINSGEYTSFTAAALILGQSGNTAAPQDIASMLSVTADGKPLTTAADGGAYVADIPDGVKKIEVACSDCGTSLTPFWTIIEQGYPKKSRAESVGIDIVREYYDTDGNRITSAKPGVPVTVKITARTRSDVAEISSAVIIDLLPGGLVADTASVDGPYDFAEVREDRVVIYAPLSRKEATYTYAARTAATGTFAIPPIHAESMYNAGLRATGPGGTFTVSNETNN